MNEFKQDEPLVPGLEIVENSKKNLVYQAPKKSDYLLIDESARYIDLSYQCGDLNLLFHALDSMHYWLNEQKIIQFPESFEEFHVVDALHCIILNEDSVFPLSHAFHAISCLNFIFQSTLMCEQYLTPDFFAHICVLLSAWPSFDVEDKKFFYDTFGDLVQLCRFVISYDKEFIPIYQNLPFEHILEIHHSMNEKHIYSTVSISYFLYTYFDLIDEGFILSNLPIVLNFFTYISYCFELEVEKSYYYNLWAIYNLIKKLNINFPLQPFITIHLNKFLDACILSSNHKNVELSLYIIKTLYSPIKTTECITNEDLINVDGVQFFKIEPGFINLENIMILPKFRDDLKSFKTKALALSTMETIFRYNPETLQMCDEYSLPDFSDMNVEMKKAAISLLLFLIQSFTDEKLRELVQAGLFNLEDGILDKFCELIDNEHLISEILSCILSVLKRIEKYDEYPFLIVLLQEERFQEQLEEIALKDNEQNAKLANELKSITAIEDVE